MEGKKRRQRGYIEELAKEANGFSISCDLQLPTELFIPRIVRKMNCKQNSAHLKAHAELKIEKTKARKADPVKCALDQEIKRCYGFTNTPRVKDKHRGPEEICNTGIGNSWTNSTTHILIIQKFIRNHKKRDCNSIMLQHLMEHPLDDPVFVNDDSAHTRKHEKMYRIAAY